MKKTICWGCANYSTCSWSKGIPVKGWKATPTKIINKHCNKDKSRIIDSFLVEECPQFKEDRKKKTTIAEIAKILDIHERSVYGVWKRKGMAEFRDRLKRKGYKLYAEKSPIKNSTKTYYQYYLEK